ncbi:MAG: V-type ATP synthase subunit I [Candidatus Caldatribacteriota bacterium]|nr:V-type ATP synthase subunit I [Candidatus Caldatribacteriota bacterium]
MTVCKIKKANFFTHIKLKDKLVKDLQKVGCIQIKDITSKMDKSHLSQYKEVKDLQIDSMLSEVKYCIDYFSLFKDKSKKPEKFIDKTKILYDYNKLDKLFTDYEYTGVYNECKELDNTLKDIKNRENYLNNLKDYLSEWEDLTIKLEDLKDSEKTSILVGIIELKNLSLCTQEISEVGKEIEIIKISQSKKHCKIAIISIKSLYDAIRKKLNKFNFNYFKIPGEYNGNIKYVKQKIKKEITELQKKREIINEKSINIYEENVSLYVIYDYLSILKSRKDLEKYMKQTDKVIIIEGWVLEKDQDRLKKYLYGKYKELEIVFSNPKKDDNIPVALNNNQFVEPFESVTELYGIPKYKEVDPTPLFTPFYFIFFGMCLSDAGYGLVIAALSYFALKKFKFEGMAKKLFGLFFLGGISSFLIGAIMGSWMGDSLNYLPKSMQSIRIFLADKVTLLDPIENPMPLLLISLILGVIQIYTGFIVKFAANVKEKKITIGLMDQGSWLLLISGIIFSIITAVIPSFSGMKMIANYVIYAGLISIVLTQGRRNKGIILKIAGGVISLYDLIGYFSDILSYSRLFALGLSTAVLAVVVNNFVMLFKDIPFLGIILAIFVFIIGHIFNIVINGMGAFIHTTRLQYVEFFTKFYEGGGSAFKPFRVNAKYIKIQANIH